MPGSYGRRERNRVTRKCLRFILSTGKRQEKVFGEMTTLVPALQTLIRYSYVTTTALTALFIHVSAALYAVIYIFAVFYCVTLDQRCNMNFFHSNTGR